MNELLFSSKEELFKRVKPALKAKKYELQRLGYLHVKDTDIWNYLIETKWKGGSGLDLSDIVSDIMHTDNKDISKYLNDNEEVRRRVDRDLEIIGDGDYEEDR